MRPCIKTGSEKEGIFRYYPEIVFPYKQNYLHALLKYYKKRRSRT